MGVDPPPVPPPEQPANRVKPMAAIDARRGQEAASFLFRRTHPKAIPAQTIGRNGLVAGCDDLAIAPAETVMVVLAEPPLSGSIVAGEKLHETLAGSPEHAKETVPIPRSPAAFFPVPKT